MDKFFKYGKRSFVTFIILVILEAIFYYLDIIPLRILFRITIWLFLFFIYFLGVNSSLKVVDKLLLNSLVFTIIGEILFIYNSNNIFLILVLLTYLIEHQFYFMIFRKYHVIDENFKNTRFLGKGWPYLVIAFFFFGFILMNAVPDTFFILVILYVFQSALLGVFSLLLNNKLKGKKWLILGVGLNSLADAVASYYLFVENFHGDYLVVRLAFVFAKYFIFYGFLLNRYPKAE